MKPWLKKSVLIMALSSLYSVSVYADTVYPPMSLESAVKKAKSKSDGKVLSTKTRRSKGEWVHKIRVLTDEGKIKTFVYPARKPRD